MGFWSFLFGDSEHTRVKDEFFGSLLLIDNCFEGKRLFAPINKDIELGIEGGLPGPTTIQKEFYQKVEEKYSALVPAVQTLITERIGRYRPNFIIQDFAEFWPVHIWLPALELGDKDPDWEIAFNTIHDRDHTFTVSMVGFSPYNVCMDG